MMIIAHVVVKVQALNWRT